SASSAQWRAGALGGGAARAPVSPPPRGGPPAGGAGGPRWGGGGGAPPPPPGGGGLAPPRGGPAPRGGGRGAGGRGRGRGGGAGALTLRSDRPAEVRGFVAAAPRRSEGEVEVRVDTADGRLAMQAPEPVPELPIGREVRASGSLRDPPPWEAGYLRRYGIAEV